MGRVVDKKSVKKRGKKFFTRYGILAGNIAIVFVVGFIIWQAQAKGEDPIHSSTIEADEDQSGPVDSISAADIATNVAYATQLPQAGEVDERYKGINYQLSLGAPEETIVQKPQIVSGGAAGNSRRDIMTYVVQPGDSVSSLAQRYNISSESIRWSNNLSGDFLTPGSTLMLPPHSRNGIVYKVQAGDTPQKLADKYKTTTDKIISFNDAEISGLPVGEYILIPDGRIETYVASYSYGFGWGGGGGGYTPGQCTWGAYNKRAEMGMPIPTNWGSAATWDDAARAQGYRVDHSPEVGAIMQSDGPWEGPAFYIYHVAVVVAVDANFYYVWDMNYSGPYSVRTHAAYPIDSARYYDFIH